jgi:hypothetical protein
VPTVRALLLALLVLAVVIGIGTLVGGATAQAIGNSAGLVAFIGITSWSKRHRHQSTK